MWLYTKKEDESLINVDDVTSKVVFLRVFTYARFSRFFQRCGEFFAMTLVRKRVDSESTRLCWGGCIRVLCKRLVEMWRALNSGCVLHRLHVLHDQGTFLIPSWNIKNTTKRTSESKCSISLWLRLTGVNAPFVFFPLVAHAPASPITFDDTVSTWDTHTIPVKSLDTPYWFIYFSTS